ncbi:hypothetical protein EDB82DRAFT_522501 [Fusarium venenatum]|uniref:uncharacterized protein n=1 Tax=Fusarium venenatum TaxID=56646 RepID=UPI001D3E8029|nr:hypothetical protein EDB82DRAFT_522501 [Fusarium venenatum]
MAVAYLSNNYPNSTPFAKHLSWASMMRYETKTHVPTARVQCNPHGVMNKLNLRLPDADQKYRYYETHVPMPGPEVPGLVDVDVLNNFKSHLVRRKLLINNGDRMNRSIFSEDLSVIIAPVDIWSVTNSSLGIVILLKNTWNVTLGTRYTTNALTCSVDARWAKAKSVQTGDWGAWVPHEFYFGRISSSVGTELELQARIGRVRFKAPRDKSIKPISISTDWHDTLSPTLLDILPNRVKQLPYIRTKMTTLEGLVKTKYHPDESLIVSFESIIAANVVEGFPDVVLAEIELIPQSSTRYK